MSQDAKTSQTRPAPSPELLDLGSLSPNSARVPAEALHSTWSIAEDASFAATRILCEEAAERGIPVIAIDTEGALLSLARAPTRKDVEAGRVDADRVRRWRRRTDVVVWTPASSAGVPLALTPFDLAFETTSTVKRVRTVTAWSGALAELLGYEGRRGDARFVQAALDLVVTWLLERDLRPRDLEDLAGFLLAMPRDLARAVAGVLDREPLTDLARRVHTLGIGAHRLLFTHGMPLDVDTLLGREPRAGRGKAARVSIVHLDGLPSEVDRAFVVAELARELLAASSAAAGAGAPLRALLAIADVAPFLGAKASPTRTLLKRILTDGARLGLGTVIATAHPELLDEKAFLAAGEVAVSTLDPDAKAESRDALARLVATRMPESSDAHAALRRGRYRLASRDRGEAALGLRLPLTSRDRIAPDAIEDLVTADQRQAFEERTRALLPLQPSESLAEQRGGAAGRPADAEASLGLTGEPSGNARERQNHALRRGALELLRAARGLVSPDDVSEELDVGKRTAVRILGELVDSGAARRVERGVKRLYHAAEFHHHPKIGLLEHIETAPTLKAAEQALGAAKAQLDRLLWVLPREIVDTEQVRLIHYPLWRCAFVGFAREGLFRRLRTRPGNVYMHPVYPEVCVITKSEGFRFVTTSFDVNPLDIKDLDDISRLERSSARDVHLAEWVLDELMDPADIKERFRDKFSLDVEDIRLVYLPVWEFVVHAARDPQRHRVVFVDAVLGRPFDPLPVVS